MEAREPEVRWRDAHGILRAALLALLPLAIAAGLTRVVGVIDARSFDDVLLLPPEPLGAFRFALALAAAAAGYFAVFFAPGLLVMRALRLRLPNAPANTLAAFVLSLLATSLAWITAQAVTHDVAGRTCLYLTVAVLDVAALAAGIVWAPGAPALPQLPDSRRGTGRRELFIPVVGVVLLIATVWIAMPGKVAIEALDGDATEVHGFAASLFTRAVPEWDLESGAWGFYPTFMFVAYPVFESLALLGDTEAALRLPALLFFAVLVLALADLAGRGLDQAAGGSQRVLLPLLAAGFLSLQVGAYYAGYHPFHGDLGAVALDEWVAAALVMCGFVLLRDGAPGIAAIAALLASLAFPSGLPLSAFVGVSGLLVGDATQRRVILRWSLTLAVLVVVYALFVVAFTKANGTFDAMIREWWSKYFAGRARLGSDSPARMLRAVGWWALLAGGLPVAGQVLGLFARDRMSRWLALVALLWVAVFVLSPNKNIHYVLPVALIPTAVSLRLSFGITGLPSWLALRPLSRLGQGLLSWLAPALLTLSVLGVIALSRPRTTAPYVADREFGRRSIFLAAGEREAVEFSHVLFNVMDALWKWRPDRPWVVGHHTWAMYADRGFDVAREYDFYVAQVPPPAAGLMEVTRINGTDGRPVVLWARGGRAALREWKRRVYPLRTEQSRFNFEMGP